jgi:predicted RNA binding protein YcfA (HicA-like mRNA interferase family)
MPRLPRNLSGVELIRRLRAYGYSQTRQTGSHVRLTRFAETGEQHLTIPRHAALRVGTLQGILCEVAGQLGKHKDELQRELFG